MAVVVVMKMKMMGDDDGEDVGNDDGEQGSG